MARQHVMLQSTALASAEYDDETQTLDVTFRNGRSYTFENVPETVFEGLRHAPSPGSYFTSNIKGAY